jgi:tetratricopeptide (TPR) repeat protein
VSEPLADLLAAGERAAFHAPPAAGIGPLQQAVVEGRATGHDAEAAMAAWLLGVCLSASGRWGSALTVLRPLLLRDDAELEGVGLERLLVASLAASTSAGVLRQLGEADQARSLDLAAERLAGGSDEARFDALLGRAADALGSGDLDAAAASLAAAETLTGARSDWWRQRVRLDWGRAELALQQGRPDEAALRASAALARAESSGAPRHVAKSLLLLGAALVQGGELDEAVATLKRCVTLAEPLALLPVLWSARALVGALTLESEPAAAEAVLDQARADVQALADDLPDPLRARWLARDDVAALTP